MLTVKILKIVGISRLPFEGYPKENKTVTMKIICSRV
jgi:hypothetical protein